MTSCPQYHLCDELSHHHQTYNPSVISSPDLQPVCSITISRMTLWHQNQSLYSDYHLPKEDQEIKVWLREAWKEEALDDLPWQDERGPWAPPVALLDSGWVKGAAFISAIWTRLESRGLLSLSLQTHHRSARFPAHGSVFQTADGIRMTECKPFPVQLCIWAKHGTTVACKNSWPFYQKCRLKTNIVCLNCCAGYS